MNTVRREFLERDTQQRGHRFSDEVLMGYYPEHQ